MTRLTCGPLLLEACRQGCVTVNILEHLQIPQFRLAAQIRLPVLGAPGKRLLPKLPADTMMIDLTGALTWCSKCLESGRSRLVLKSTCTTSAA